MKFSLSQLAKGLAVLTFITGLSVFTLQILGKQGPIQRQPFVMTSLVHQVVNGTAQPAHRKLITAVDPVKNTFKITHIDLASGKTRLVFGDATAFYNVTEKTLEYVDVCDYSNTFNENSRSEDFFLKNPLFVRTEQLGEHKVFTLRNDHPDEWVEDSYALSTGFYALKRVRFNKDTGEQLVEQAIKVEFRPLTPDEVQWPDLPKSFAQVEQRIAAMQKGSPNNQRQANFTLQNLTKVKQKQGLR